MEDSEARSTALAIAMIGVIPEPAAKATRWTDAFLATSSAASRSGSFMLVSPSLEMNAPWGFMTSSVSPAFRELLAQVEKTPPMSCLIATRISPGRGSAQIE